MSEEKLLDGLVLRTTGLKCIVKTSEGSEIECIVRGKFRIKGLVSTNPVSAGDHVLVKIPSEGTLATIKKIYPRKNYILRKAVGQSHKVHILASNIDQALLIFTIDHPRTSLGFADRFLVVAEAYHIPALILINKIDLLETEEQKERLQKVLKTYELAEYDIVQLNALNKAHRSQIVSLLSDKISFVGGHSGAGKSTIINLVDPTLHLKTSDISSSSNKGKHTTTFAQMHPLKSGGYVIDSPGIKELGLIHFERNEISHFFPEMRKRLNMCKFNNCMHINEPKCAIKEALKTGEIAESRYRSYLTMLEEISAEKQY